MDEVFNLTPSSVAIMFPKAYVYDLHLRLYEILINLLHIYFFQLTDSCHFPTLCLVEHRRLFLWTREIHPRAMAEEWWSLSTRYSSICEFAIWIWTTNMHRTSICRCWTCHSTRKGKYWRKICWLTSVEYFFECSFTDFPQISCKIQLWTNEISCQPDICSR